MQLSGFISLTGNKAVANHNRLSWRISRSLFIEHFMLGTYFIHLLVTKFLQDPFVGKETKAQTGHVTCSSSHIWSLPRLELESQSLDSRSALFWLVGRNSWEFTPEKIGIRDAPHCWSGSDSKDHPMPKHQTLNLWLHWLEPEPPGQVKTILSCNVIGDVCA